MSVEPPMVGLCARDGEDSATEWFTFEDWHRLTREQVLEAKRAVLVRLGYLESDPDHLTWWAMTPVGWEPPDGDTPQTTNKDIAAHISE